MNAIRFSMVQELGKGNRGHKLNPRVICITGLEKKDVSKALFRYQTLGLIKVVDGKNVYPRKYIFQLIKIGIERYKYISDIRDNFNLCL